MTSFLNKKLETAINWETATVGDVNQKINSGADVNARDKHGATPLILAGWFNQNPEVIVALIDAGADVNARNDRGETALIYAENYNGNPEVAKTLKELGGQL